MSRAGEMALLAKGLPCRSEDLSITPRTHSKILTGVVVCVCSSSPGEETGGFLGLTGQST